MFDPYLEWLGIPKDQRPITFYRLLGVPPKEVSPEAIDRAAELRSDLVAAHEGGSHAASAARLLKEIEQARTVLRNPTKRREYDARLRQGAPKKAAPAPAPAAAIEDDEPDEQQRPRKKGQRRPIKEEQKSPVLLFVVLGLGALLLLVGGGALIAFVARSGSQTDSTPVASALETSASNAERPANRPQPDAPPPPRTEAPKSDPPSKPVDPPKPPPPAPTPAPAKPAVAKTKDPPIERKPEPSGEAVQAAVKVLREQFKEDYERPKPEDRIALSAKLLVPGREDRNNLPGWFALLREARDLAIEGKRPRLAFEAIADMEKYFMVDGPALRVKAIEEMTRDGAEISAIASTLRATQNLIDQAYTAENHAAARQYLDAMEGPVRAAKGEEMLRRLRELRFELAEYSREFEAVKAARATLQQSPDDAEANLTVGRYLCLFQGEWDEGLRMLAKSTGGGLRDLARKELADPADVKEQIAVANGWWLAAESLRERGQLIVTRHARRWYEKAGAQAVESDRQHVINRIMAAQQREYVRFTRLAPGSFLGRAPEDRILLLREGGGDLKSEEAIERGLEWLAAHQSASGAWSMDGFHRAAKCKCTEAGEKHDVAGTALAMMSFLGAGHTHRRGKYAPALRKALDWLLRQQKPSGGNFHDNAYEHALATIALVELFGMSQDRSLSGPSLAATLYIINAQFTDGSWGYSKNTKGDLSITGWQFTALKSASYAGLPVPKATLDRLSAFLDSVEDPNGLGYGYNSPGAGPSTSAAGILCRQFLGLGPGHPGLTKAVNHLLQPGNHLTKDRNNMYAVFYMTQVAHHLGGEYWEKWNRAIRDVLIENQDKGDTPDTAHQKGSWSPRGDTYAKQGGRLMYTALSLIALEAPYYHIPLYGYGPYVLLD